MERHINKWVEIRNKFLPLFLYETHPRRIEHLYRKKKVKEKEERDDLNAKKKKKVEGFLEVSFWSWSILWAPLKKMEQCFNIGFDRNSSVDFYIHRKKRRKSIWSSQLLQKKHVNIQKWSFKKLYQLKNRGNSIRKNNTTKIFTTIIFNDEMLKAFLWDQEKIRIFTLTILCMKF